MNRLLSLVIILVMASTLVIGNLENLNLPDTVGGNGKSPGTNIHSRGVLRRAGGVDGPLAGRLVVAQGQEPLYLRQEVEN